MIQFFTFISFVAAGFCEENHYVHDGKCKKCPKNSENYNIDSTTGSNTSCTCNNHHHVKNRKCEPCPIGYRLWGQDDFQKGNTRCTECDDNYFMKNGKCSPCPSGSSSLGGGNYATCKCHDDHKISEGTCVPCSVGYISSESSGNPQGNDTSCNRCAEGYHVQNGKCEPCPSGSWRFKGDDPNGVETTCRCIKDHFVQKNKCVKCPIGSQHFGGDDPTGMDTSCQCQNDHFVSKGECKPCEVGFTRQSSLGGDEITGKDTTCKVCSYDSYAKNGTCNKCPEESFSEYGDGVGIVDPTLMDSTCRCHSWGRVQKNKCAPCPVGYVKSFEGDHYNGDDVFGDDTKCTLCDRHYHVRDGKCEKCPPGSKRYADDDPSGKDTYCECEPNHHVQDGKCAKCPKDMWRAKGDKLNGGDTYCAGDGSMNKTTKLWSNLVIASFSLDITIVIWYISVAAYQVTIFKHMIGAISTENQEATTLYRDNILTRKIWIGLVGIIRLFQCTSIVGLFIVIWKSALNHLQIIMIGCLGLFITGFLALGIIGIIYCCSTSTVWTLLFCHHHDFIKNRIPHFKSYCQQLKENISSVVAVVVLMFISVLCIFLSFLLSCVYVVCPGSICKKYTMNATNKKMMSKKLLKISHNSSHKVINVFGPRRYY